MSEIIGDKSMIAKRIIEAMEYRKMTQADLVRETGLSKATISFYVRGKTPPKIVKKLSFHLCSTFLCKTA